MGRKLKVCLLCVLLVLTSCFGCGKSKTTKYMKLDTSEKVTLKVVGTSPDFKELEEVGLKFQKLYPNCTVQYECIQDYDELAPKRLQSKDSDVDLFLTSNIQKDSIYYPYALNLNDNKYKVNLSDSFDGIIKNCKLIGSDDLYAIPMTAEVRGLYVNKTLLKKYNLEVPTNKKEFLNVCQKLSEHGYVPIQGNPGMAAMQFIYPYIANIAASSKENYNKIAKREEGVHELFRPAFECLYELVQKKYYNYKYVENEYGEFTDTSYEGYARSFFNIKEKDDDFIKQDDLGRVAFMPSSAALETTMRAIQSDFHSKIEYTFIVAPVSEDGGYAYLSPGKAIAVNKQSQNKEWSVEFLNFFFEEENNKEFAKSCGLIPNTKDAKEYVGRLMNVLAEQVTQLGDATFDYPFYQIVEQSIIPVAKANNPKYMKKISNNEVQMYSLNYYMKQFGDALEQSKK